MRKALCILFCFSLVGLIGCPTGDGPSLPLTTDGGGWFINTGYISPTLITIAPGTTVTGVWKSDGSGTAGDPSEFVVTTDSVSATAVVSNGRVPATWQITWNASTSFPDCDGYSTDATPSIQGGVEEVNCIITTAEAENSPFIFSPNPVNLYSPQPKSIIYGSGFTSQYGMPVVQYFNSQGVLVSQAEATSIAQNGASISAATPNLSGAPVGTYAGIISNVTANGSYAYVGAVSVEVIDQPPVKPIPCTGHICPVQP